MDSSLHVHNLANLLPLHLIGLPIPGGVSGFHIEILREACDYIIELVF